MFRIHRMHYLTACHPIEVRTTDCLSIAGNLDINGRSAGHWNDDGIRTGQIHADTKSARAQNVRARFVPRDQFRLLIRFIVEEQSKKKNLIFRTGLRHANAKHDYGRRTAFDRYGWQEWECL